MQQGYKPPSLPGVLFPHGYIRHWGFSVVISLTIYVFPNALVRFSDCRTVYAARIQDSIFSESI